VWTGLINSNAERIECRVSGSRLTWLSVTVYYVLHVICLVTFSFKLPHKYKNDVTINTANKKEGDTELLSIFSKY